MTGTLYTGTSGFAYKEWKGAFYPDGLKDREMLSYYASRLPSVEINYTFRRQASEKTLTNWREATPETFRFTLKANQRITHWLRLEHADEAVREFLERARLLGDRLGPILFQCPPNLEFDRSRIEAFVGYLPPGVLAAMEFRHASWEEARPILAAQGVAWCTAETDDKEADEPSWEPFGYLRLRKTEYTEDELHKWAERIAPPLADGRDIYCYFKHEDGAASAKMAMRLRAMLEDAGGSPSNGRPLETAAGPTSTAARDDAGAVEVRRANRNDTEAVLSIDDVPERAEHVRRAVVESRCQVAQTAGEIAGFCIGGTWFGFDFLELLVVAPGHRRRGVGTALARSWEAGASTAKLFTSTNESNEPMRRLCERLDYVRSGHIENLDDGDPEIIYFKRNRS